MKKKSGFTLIELLAVIVILTIVAFIATPLILGYIDKTKKSAFLRSVDGIEESALLKSAKDQLLNLANYNSSIYDTKNELKYKGKTYDGRIFVASDGSVKANIWDNTNHWCGYKGYGDKEPYLKEHVDSLNDCLLENGTNNMIYKIGENPSTPIKGTFIQPWLFQSWTKTDWEQEISYWKELGIEYLVMGDVAERQLDGSWITYYNSALPFAQQQYYEIMDGLFSALKGSGIKLFLGMGMDSAWWNLDLTKATDQEHFVEYATESSKIIEELYHKYHNVYPEVFYGVYFVPELSNSSAFSEKTTRDQFVNGLTNGLNILFDKLNQLNPNMPFLFSPYTNYFGGSWVTKNPEDLEQFYTELFQTANFRDNDILMPQDSLGSAGMDLEHLDKFMKAYKNATTNTIKKIKFWSNTELFNQPASELQQTTDGVNYWGSSPINRVVAQLNMEKYYAENIFVFAYSHYISPKNAVAGYQTAIRDYFTTGKTETIDLKTPTSIKTEVKSLNGTDVLTLSWKNELDIYGIARVNIYKDGKPFTYRVSTRKDHTGNSPSYPETFYDGEFDLNKDSAVYELEFIDCAGNKSKKVTFVVPKKQTNNIIEASKEKEIKLYQKYKIGDQITLQDGSSWHVISDSGVLDDRVKLLRDESIGIYPFDQNNSRPSNQNTYCTASSYGGCNAWKSVEGFYQNNSLSGTVIENSTLYNYLNRDYKIALTNAGVKGILGDIELITKADYDELIPQKFSWFANNTYWWTMTPYPTNNVDVYVIGATNDLYNTLVTNDQNFHVRPVIILNKNNLEAKTS